MKIHFFVILLLGLTISCSTNKTSVLVYDDYSPENNLTTLTLFPYGNITIPGKWERTKYDAVSRQYFFRDNDSTSIAVAKNLQSDYPFYTTNISDQEFVDKFYNWEREYFEEHGFQVSERQSGENYKIWQVTGEKLNNWFLYGAKNGLAYNFAVYKSTWDEAEKAAFLKSLLDQN